MDFCTIYTIQRFRVQVKRFSLPSFIPFPDAQLPPASYQNFVFSQK